MKTELQPYYDVIIQTCLKDYEQNNTVGIRSVIKSMPRTDLPYSLFAGNISETDIQSIAAKITKDQKLTSIQINDDTYIIKNPNYELNQSLLQTNENVRKTNNRTWIIAAIAALFALGSFLTQIFQSDKGLQEQLKQINTQFQKQTQSLDTIDQSLKEMNHSIQNVADSIPK